MMIPSTSTRPRPSVWPSTMLSITEHSGGRGRFSGCSMDPSTYLRKRNGLIAGKLLKSRSRTAGTQYPKDTEDMLWRFETCFPIQVVSQRVLCYMGYWAISAQKPVFGCWRARVIEPPWSKQLHQRTPTWAWNCFHPGVNARKTLTLAACGSRTFKDLKSIAASLANVSPLYQGCEKEIMNDALRWSPPSPVNDMMSYDPAVIDPSSKTECFREVGSQIQFWVDEGFFVILRKRIRH